MDLLEEVLHAFDEYVPRKYVQQLDDGTTRDIEWKQHWLEWWAGQPYHRAYLTAVQFLAVIVSEIRQRQTIPLDRERQVLDQWANALRAGVAQGRIRARTPDSLLPLDSAPDGWEWCVSTTDADAWLAEQGAGWKCGEVIGYLHRVALNSRMPPIRCGHDEDEEVAQISPAIESPQISHEKNTKWSQEQLQALLDESRTKTQTELADVYGLSRQRIGKLLRDAKQAFGTKSKTDLAVNPMATIIRF